MLLADNVLTNRVLPSSTYVPVRLVTVAACLLVAVRVGGCSANDLGLDRRRVTSGLRLGGIVAVVTVLVMLAGSFIPATEVFFRDDRAGGVGVAGLLYQVLFRIPLGTVLPEELLFRGVVLGLASRTWRPPAAMAASAFLFGLWHVLPALGLVTANEGVSQLGLGRGVVLSAVVSTAAAGLVFAWLRLRSGSVVAPMLLHVATNSVGFTLAWAALR